MTKFKAEMEWFGVNGELGVKVPCAVEFSGSNIYVHYLDLYERQASYSGSDQGYGHYKLKCDQTAGDGTLHRFLGQDSASQPEVLQFLDGYWREEGSRGMWRIQLIANA